MHRHHGALARSVRRALYALAATSLALATVTTSAPPVAARTATTAPAPPAAPAAKPAPTRLDPGTLTVPTDAELEAWFAMEVPQRPELSPARNQQIAAFNEKDEALLKELETIPDTEQSLQERVADFNAKVDAYNKDDAAVGDQVTQHNTKVDALKARIDAHNAEPHTFQLPDQQAAADAYQAEADELNGEKNALNAEETTIQGKQTNLDNEKTDLDTQQSTIQTDIDSFKANLDTIQNEANQLETDRLNLLEGIMGDLENLASQQAAQPAPDQESYGASQAQAGGDASRPPEVSDDPVEQQPRPRMPFQPSNPGRQTDPTTPVQPDPQLEQSAGGDTPSRSGQNQALESYAKQHNVTVEQTPVTVQLSPDTLRTLKPDQATQVSLSDTFQGLVRKPSGTYKALRVVAPGTVYGPGDQAFDDVVNRGGKAIGLADGSKIVIDEIGSISHVLPEPAQPGPSQSASTSQPPEPTDCTHQKPAGADDLQNNGWVEYFPLEAPTNRAKGMQACLVGYKKVQDTNPSKYPAGWGAAVTRAMALTGITDPKKNPLARCHFLAARFGGSNDKLENFTTCWQYPVNVGRMSRAENAVAAALGKNDWRVTFVESAVYDTPASDTPSEYWVFAAAQVPGSDEVLPLYADSIPNAQNINGTMQNIGN